MKIRHEHIPRPKPWRRPVAGIDIVRAGKSLFDRGLTFGSTGNISVKMSGGRMLMIPTNASLEPERLSLFSAEGVHLSGDKPTKEAFLHRCMYCARPHGKAVVHLHSTYSVAVSILKDVDEKDVLPPLTAYCVMRVGTPAIGALLPSRRREAGHDGTGGRRDKQRRPHGEPRTRRGWEVA